MVNLERFLGNNISIFIYLKCLLDYFVVDRFKSLINLCVLFVFIFVLLRMFLYLSEYIKYIILFSIRILYDKLINW